jgi:hypothetical protein
VEQYSPIPYVATLLNCMMWVLYGLPAVHPHSMLVITINGTGMAIQLTYVALFLLYSAGAARRKVVLLLAAEVGFVGAVAALVLSLAHTHERRSMVVGILCVLFGTGMYAAPLSVMVRTRTYVYIYIYTNDSRPPVGRPAAALSSASRASILYVGENMKSRSGADDHYCIVALIFFYLLYLLENI